MNLNELAEQVELEEWRASLKEGEKEEDEQSDVEADLSDALELLSDTLEFLDALAALPGKFKGTVPLKVYKQFTELRSEVAYLVAQYEMDMRE